MGKYKYLDRKQSKKIFELGFVKYDYVEMCAFARWAKNCEGWSKEKIEKHIRSEFFKKGLNIVLMADEIHRAVLGSRFDFLEQETVTITKTEVEKISKLKNRQYQKAMFGILVFAKKYGIPIKSNIYIWQSLKDVIIKSGVPMSQKEYFDFITYINKDMGYVVSTMRKRKLSWRVQICSEGEEFCTITEFSDFQKLLPYWCVECGKETGSRNKYCEEHSAESIRKRTKMRVEKFRKSV